MILTPAYLEERNIPYQMEADGEHFRVPGRLVLMHGVPFTSLGKLISVGDELSLIGSSF